MAQLIVGTAAAVGTFAVTGSPQAAQWAFVGASAAFGAYQVSRQRIDGPRLTDAQIINASYGNPVPWVNGSGRVAGQIIWASDRREIATSQRQGKGSGPTVTSYSYEQDVLFVLTANQTAGVARIFLNGKLIWTRLTGADASSLANSNGTDLWRRLTIYTGGPTQLPDPTYEAAVGVGNAPAHRGCTTVMIEGLQEGNSGQIPNLTFETLTDTARGVGDITLTVNVPWPTPYFSRYAGTPAKQSTQFQVPIGVTASISAPDIVVTVFNVDATAGTYSAASSYTLAGIAATTPSPVQGTSDTTCLMLISTSGTTLRLCLGTTGTSSTYTVPSALGNARFALDGSTLIVGSTSSGGKVLYRFTVGTSGPIVTSSPLPQYVNSLLIVGSTLYASSRTTTEVYVLDVATLTLQSTITRPGLSSDTWTMLTTFDGAPAVVENPASQTVRIHQLVGSSFVQVGQINTTDYYATAERFYPTVSIVGGLVVGGLNNTTDQARYDVWVAPITIGTPAVSLQTTVERLCARAGMPAGTYDASALSAISKPVRSLVIGQVGATRSTFEILRQSHFFYAVTSDKMYFRPITQSSGGTIPLEMLGAAQDQAAADALPLTMGDDLGLPAQISVTYRNVSDDYQDGTEYSDRLLSGQVSVSAIELAVGMTPSEAKGVADALVVDGLAGLTTGNISLPLQYAKYEPGDVVTIDGLALRLGRRSEQDGVLSFDVRRHDSSAIASAGTTDGGYTSTNTVTKPGDTVFLALDVPLLRDVDDGPGPYIAAKGSTTLWPGGQVHASTDNVTFVQAAEVNESGTFGVCTTTLGDYAGVGVDERNALTVNVGNGTLASSTRDAMFADETINCAAVGSLAGGWEIIRFVQATLVSAGVYTVSRLFRGERGTEAFMATHAASESFVLLTARGMRKWSTQANAIGQLRYLKSITLGASVFKNPVSFTDTGRTVRCLSPVYLRLTSSSGGPLISWTRRTRYSTKWVGAGASFPLGETTESYVVRVYADSGYTLLVRSFTATTASVRYPADALAGDISAYSGGAMYVEVRQINSQGSEGAPGRAVLYASEGDTEAGPLVGFVSQAGARAVGAFSGSLVALDYGSTPLGNVSRIMTSADDGATWSVSFEGFAQVGWMSGTLGLDLIGAKRLSWSWNYEAGIPIKALIVATDNTTAPSLTDPAPVVGGQYIFPSAAAMDGSDYIMVGTPQDAVSGRAVDVTKLYLYRSTNGTTWTLDGQMLPDGADPNALTSVYSFSALGFLGFSPTFPQGALLKVGTRWFYSTRFALHYTDDLTLLSGWKRCPTGLGEGALWPYITLGNLVQYSGQLAICKRGVSGNSVAYSNDNGVTWTAIRPTAQGTAELTFLYAHAGSLVGLVSRGTGVHALKTTSVAGTWTSAATTGLGTLAQFAVTVSGSNAIATSTFGGVSGLRYSADSVTWTTSTVS